MGTVTQSYSTTRAVVQPTNAALSPVALTALSDGDGNLVGASSPASALVTIAAGAQAASNAGQSFATASVSVLAVDVNVTGFTGGTAPSVTFFVERQGSDSAWYRVWQSAAVSAAGTVSVSIGASVSTVAAGTNIAQGVSAALTATARFGWSSTGTPTAITFSASVVGRP